MTAASTIGGADFAVSSFGLQRELADATRAVPIFAQPDAAAVADQLDSIAAKLGRQFPAVEAMLRDAAVDIGAFAAFPQSHWKKIWSTNPLERVNKEIKRRTNVVKNETLGHRGRKHGPLYRIRKLLVSGSERLDERGQDPLLLGLRVGDPHDDVLGAWLAKESEVYLTDDPDEAALLLDKAVAGYTADDVPEIHIGSNAHRVADRDPRPPHHRRVQRTDRGPEPLRQEGQAMRPRLPQLRALPPPRLAPRRRCHLASTPITATNPNPDSLLRRVEPDLSLTAATRALASWCGCTRRIFLGR